MLAISNLTDNVIKATLAKKSEGSSLFMFTVVKSGMIGGSLSLAGMMLKSYNISLGDENAESIMFMMNSIPIRLCSETGQDRLNEHGTAKGRACVKIS